MSTSKKLPILPFVVSLICLLVGVLIGQSFKSTPSADPKPTTTQAPKTAVMAVQAISPVRQSVKETLNASGVIAGKDIAQVGARVSGVAITSVLVDVGDHVKAGQVLARLENTSSQEQIQMASAELERAKASLDKATSDVARVAPLLDIDAISRQSYDAYVTAEREAVATVKSLEARLASTKTTNRHTDVVAPVSGIISEKNADIGMIATGTPLFSIIKNGTLEWQASLPASQANKIRLGQLATLNVAETEILASVDKIAPIANNSREVTVHATLPASANLRAGMYQAGQFILGAKDSLTLPYKAISTSDGMDYVWTLTKSDGDLYQAHRTPVTILTYQQDVVAVEMDENSLVVASSGNFLSDGSLVRLIQATPDTSIKSE